MIAEVRAIADRFTLDTANVKYVAVSLPKDALERVVENSGWTVRQTFGHLAVSLENYANALDWLLQGVEQDENGRYPWPRSAETLARTAKMPLPKMIGLLDSSLVRFVRLCEHVDESVAASSIARQPFLDVVRAWSGHSAEHGLDFADALPELRFDSMVLNWLLHADYADASQAARQHKLLGEVREQLIGEGNGGP